MSSISDIILFIDDISVTSCLDGMDQVSGYKSITTSTKSFVTRQKKNATIGAG